MSDYLVLMISSTSGILEIRCCAPITLESVKEQILKTDFTSCSTKYSTVECQVLGYWNDKRVQSEIYKISNSKISAQYVYNLFLSVLNPEVHIVCQGLLILPKKDYNSILACWDDLGFLLSNHGLEGVTIDCSEETGAIKLYNMRTKASITVTVDFMQQSISDLIESIAIVKFGSSSAVSNLETLKEELNNLATKNIKKLVGGS